MRYFILTVCLLSLLAVRAFAGDVQLCTELGPDEIAQNAGTKFPVGTKHLYAVFKLDDHEKFASLTARWVAVDAEKTPDNTELATAEMELGTARRGVFEMEQPEPLMKGKYKLEIKADGNAWKTIAFTVGS